MSEQHSFAQHIDDLDDAVHLLEGLFIALDLVAHEIEDDPKRARHAIHSLIECGTWLVGRTEALTGALRHFVHPYSQNHAEAVTGPHRASNWRRGAQ